MSFSEGISVAVCGNCTYNELAIMCVAIATVQIVCGIKIMNSWIVCGLKVASYCMLKWNGPIPCLIAIYSYRHTYIHT